MLLTLVIFISVLSILVFVHELGHFWTARKFGIKSEEFGFGFPPRICGWKKVNGKRKFFWGSADVKDIKSEDTIISLNWIPLGGFVNIKGEDGQDKDASDSFASKKVWKRLVVISAGVIMNVVLASICLMIAFGLGAPQVVDETNENAVLRDQKIQIISMVPESPAALAGIGLGDALISINGTEFEKVEDIQNFIATRENETLKIKVDRMGEEKEFDVTPVALSETEGKPAVGVGLAKTALISYPWYKAIWLGIKGTGILLVQIIIAFAGLIKGALWGSGVSVEVAGPVGIAVMTGRVARMGFVYLLQFIALLSLNLAIINFLPFPALDGGRAIFLIIEKIRGKAVNQKVEQVVHTVGFVLLMILFVLITGRDVIKLDVIVNLWEKIVS